MYWFLYDSTGAIKEAQQCSVTEWTNLNGYAGAISFPLSDSSAQEAYSNSSLYVIQNNQLVQSSNYSSLQLQTTKNNRIAYLESQYVQTLAKGFASSALGTTYTYGLSDSDEAEWKALNVAITRNAYPTAGYALKCFDSTGAVQYITHTLTQAEQVLLDGSTFGLNQLSNLRTKINNVNAVQLANYATLQDAENAVNAITY